MTTPSCSSSSYNNNNYDDNDDIAIIIIIYGCDFDRMIRIVVWKILLVRAYILYIMTYLYITNS